jgi:hypothetical protein
MLGNYHLSSIIISIVIHHTNYHSFEYTGSADALIDENIVCS